MSSRDAAHRILPDSWLPHASRRERIDRTVWCNPGATFVVVLPMIRPVVVVFTIILCLAVARSGASAELTPRTAYRLVDDLFSDNADVRENAKRRLVAARDVSIAPALVEVIFFSRNGRADANDILEALLGERVNRNEKGFGYKDWFEVIGRREDIVPKPGYLEFKAKQYGRIDSSFIAFLDPRHPRTIRPEEIIFGGVRKDGIPALSRPAVLPASEASFLDDDETVFGVSISGEHRAYPKRILVRHEMANDVVGGHAVSLAYCTLCGSPILYGAKVESGETYTFGTSGLLHRSNKLMYDRQTETLWSQIEGIPVMGPLVGKGKRLEVLPLVVSRWGDWRSRHPDTTVVSLEQGFGLDYSPGAAYADYFASPDLMFPVWVRDDSVEAKTVVWVVYAGGGEKAYPLKVLLAKRILADSIGGVPVIHLADSEGGWVRSFESGGRVFELREEGLADTASGELFAITEEALVSQSDSGVRFPRLPSHESFWFGWFAANPDGDLFGGTIEPMGK